VIAAFPDIKKTNYYQNCDSFVKFIMAGFRDVGAGPRPPTNRRPLTTPLNFFWLMTGVSLVVLIEDYEINEN